MTPTMHRAVTALLLGPLSVNQVRDALSIAESTAQLTLQRLRHRNLAFRMASRHHITGRIVWQHTLTHRGVEVANQIINGENPCTITCQKILFRRTIRKTK